MNGTGVALVMHYPIDLPTDYDMGTIRERVRTRGGALDDRKGLLAKAYCVRQAGVDGSRANQYAPFYLWSDADAAADFLWGGTGFDGIIRDFGRPAVRTWVPAALAAGGRPAPEVTHAALRTSAVPRDADLVAAARRLADRVGRRAEDPRVHLAAAGIDPSTWQLVEFTTLRGREATAPAEGAPETTSPETTGLDTTVFTVLHISQPGGLS